MLDIGSLAPEFHGIDQHGLPLSLGALLSKGRLVLYFYPRDFTRVCTAEACLFRDAQPELEQAGTNIAGVSRDASEVHRRFAERNRLQFPLIADSDGSISKAYDANRWPFNMAKRITYVIAETRKILAAFQHELSAQKHLDDVRRALTQP